MQKVELISYTTPVDSTMKPQDLIAYKARVSNPSNEENLKTAEGLVRYLIRHKHWSPLEMVDACVRVTTTRDIARQMIRHRSASFQEYSQRYANPLEDLEFTIREARLQDHKNRQNSIEVDDMGLQSEWAAKQREIISLSKEIYEWAISKGIAKEQARAVLPEGLMLSRLYMKANLRTWIHYVELRTDPSTQKEHREIAEMCAREIAKVFGVITNGTN